MTKSGSSKEVNLPTDTYKLIEYIPTKYGATSVMIAQWDSSLSVLPVARVQFPATAEYFKGFFPGRSRSANPS